MKSRFASILVAAVALRAVEILAQSVNPPQTRTVAYIEGTVFLNDQRVKDPTVPVTLQMDSVVRTEQGRAEVALDGGAVLFLGDRSACTKHLLSVFEGKPDGGASGIRHSMDRRRESRDAMREPGDAL